MHGLKKLFDEQYRLHRKSVFRPEKKRNESAFDGERTARRKTDIRLASIHFKLSEKRERCPDLTKTSSFLPDCREGITGLLVGLRQVAGEYPLET